MNAELRELLELLKRNGATTQAVALHAIHQFCDSVDPYWIAPVRVSLCENGGSLRTTYIETLSQLVIKGIPGANFLASNPECRSVTIITDQAKITLTIIEYEEEVKEWQNCLM